MSWFVQEKIEQRERAIIFHEGGVVDERVRQRAKSEAVSELIEEFKTAEELREILHFLAKEAGIII
jgi:ABC-type uncharacterized transport system ATPase component